MIFSSILIYNILQFISTKPTEKNKLIWMFTGPLTFSSELVMKFVISKACSLITTCSVDSEGTPDI